ncbi:MAG: transketolase [Nitrospirales bacterium]|nr:transketolase [Nitrospira sp.]MDR4502091.1 transketolase [Nitrospirales bacterium]
MTSVQTAHDSVLDTFDVSTARKRCLMYRRRILEISQQVTALHVAPAFSCLEMVDVIYHQLMRPDSQAGQLVYRDSFLMSKGHGCLSQYVVLEDIGVLSRTDLEEYCTPIGQLGAHPDYGVPGIEASTGSLGHGMGIATGMAYADQIKDDDRSTFVLISDGELQEGSTWEAMMMAANLKLRNLVAFVDLNDFGGLARMSDGHPAFYPVLDKIRAFGWEAVEVNGHDSASIVQAVKSRTGKQPYMLVGKTVKGKGVSFMEHIPIWHYRSPNPEEYAQALSELAEVSE